MLRHILNKYPISPCAVLHQDMGHGTDKFPVLDNGAAAHEYVKEKTAYFDKLLQFVTASLQFSLFFQYSCRYKFF